MKELSVIIVSWNACGYLRDCLRSVQSTGDSVVKDVIVVDNGSTDGSQAMVAKEFPTVTLVQSENNLGFAKANNLGLKYSTGKFVALINSDVIVHGECFMELLAYLAAHADVGLIGPNVCGPDGQLQRTCRQFPTLWNTFCRSFALDTLLPKWKLFSGKEMRHWNHQNLAEVEVISGCFWVARKAAITDVGNLDERFFFYAEDVDWCKRFRDAGWNVVFVPTATATHFGGASSANAPLFFSIELLRANLSYWRKHHSDVGQAGFYLLSVLHHGIRLLLLSPKAVLSVMFHHEAPHKFQRSMVCLRWLATGHELNTPAYQLKLQAKASSTESAPTKISSC